MQEKQDLQTIFAALKPLLARYAPPLTVRVDTPGRYDVWSEKEVVIDGRRRSEVYFAALIIQKGYVGFYFMPVYAQPEMQALFTPGLLNLLKGKSCFHIRRLDEDLSAAVGAALEQGFALYQERGWV